MILLTILIGAVYGYSMKETACYVLVMDFITKKTENIKNQYENVEDADPVGIINKIVMDSFNKCNSTINDNQAYSINYNGVSSEYEHLAIIDINSYLGIKVEPNFDFILKFRKIQSDIPNYKLEL